MLQETARVMDTDTVDSLHERIVEDAESKALPEAVRLVASGKWKSRRREESNEIRRPDGTTTFQAENRTERVNDHFFRSTEESHDRTQKSRLLWGVFSVLFGDGQRWTLDVHAQLQGFVAPI